MRFFLPIIVLFVSQIFASYDIDNTAKISINTKQSAIFLKQTKTFEENQQITTLFKYYDLFIQILPQTQGLYSNIYIINIDNSIAKDMLDAVHELYPQAQLISKIKLNYFSKHLDGQTKYLIQASLKPIKQNITAINKNERLVLKKSAAQILKEKRAKEQIAQNKPVITKAATILLSDIKQAFNNNDYQKTISLCNQFSINDDNNIDVNFLLGRSYYLTGKYEDALSIYQKILIINEHLPRVKLELAQTYLMLNMKKEAIAQFNEILDNHIPDNVRKSILARIKTIKESASNNALNFLFSIELGYDSNVQNTYKDSTYPDIVINNNPLDNQYLIQSDTTTNTMFALMHSYKYNDNTKIETTLSQTSLQYNLFSDKNTISTNISSYISKSLKNNKFSYGLDYSSVQLNDSDYLKTIGFGSVNIKETTKTSIEILIIKYFQKLYAQTDQKDRNSNNIQILLGHIEKTENYGELTTMMLFGKEAKMKGDKPDVNQNLYGIILSDYYKFNNLISTNISYNMIESAQQDINTAYTPASKQLTRTYTTNGTINLEISNNTQVKLGFTTIKVNSNQTPFIYNKFLKTFGIQIKF